jgi:2-oxoisovalerate dehydrogenase E1 component
MVYPVLEAAANLAGKVEILDLRTISPWDTKAVLESVKKTSKCLVVHEDTATGGFGAEILATITEQAFEWLDAPLKRLTVPDCLIPYNVGLMNAIVPSPESIRAQIDGLLAY